VLSPGLAGTKISLDQELPFLVASFLQVLAHKQVLLCWTL